MRHSSDGDGVCWPQYGLCLLEASGLPAPKFHSVLLDDTQPGPGQPVCGPASSTVMSSFLRPLLPHE